eukprot:5993241-Pyramimonas_sp.AAC.1
MHEPAKSYVKRCRDTKDGRAAYFKLKEEICSSIPISVADLGVRNGNRDWRADLVFKPEKRRSPILGVLIPWYASHRHNDCQAVRPRGSGSVCSGRQVGPEACWPSLHKHNTQSIWNCNYHTVVS